MRVGLIARINLGPIDFGVVGPPANVLVLSLITAPV